MVLINGLKGVLIGVALVIPGLSGSIFAVVVGLYEKILDALNNFKINKRESVKFLLPIGIGTGFGVLISTKIILWVCMQYKIQSYMFFSGLVLGSVPVILKKIKFKPKYLIFTFASFLAIMHVIKLSGANNESYIAIEKFLGINDFFVMLFAGIFSVSLMAIPGVSGSVMLMVINQYGTVYNAVSLSLDFVKFVLNGDFDMAINALLSVILLIPFIIGAILGIIVIAKVLAYLLKRFETAVYYSVLGLLASALYVLFKTGFEATSFSLSATGLASLILICIICLVVGFLCTILFDSKDNGA